MNAERLKTLAEFLKTIPPKHFNLSEWVCVDGGEVSDGFISKTGCGTTGCAVGWCGNISAFREAGFVIRGDGDGAAPYYQGQGGWDAVQRFFDLNLDDAEQLFSRWEYDEEDDSNPLAVVARIEEMLGQAAPSQDTP